jgi:archaemetzincin
MDIELQPVGDIGPGLLKGLQKGLTDAIGYAVSINPAVPVPQQAYNEGRDQYLADTVIEELYPFKKKGSYLLGVTNVNLFTHGKNFVFGEASPATEVAVISLFLLQGQGREHKDNLLLERAVKEAVHEIGHLLGMDHCSDGQCVMHFSGSLIDTDIKNAYFCPHCQPRLIP